MTMILQSLFFCLTWHGFLFSKLNVIISGKDLFDGVVVFVFLQCCNSFADCSIVIIGCKCCQINRNNKRDWCRSWSGNLSPLCLLSYASPGTDLQKAVEWGSHCKVAVCNCQGSIATCGLCTKHVQGRARRGLCLRGTWLQEGLERSEQV
jgi:hypothetical protein